MGVCDLYGVKVFGFFEVRLKVEEKLSIFFEERNSTYQGGRYYRFCGDESERLVLKSNVDSFDGEAVEKMFADYPILIYVDMTIRSEEIMRLLGAEFCLLRHEVHD